MKDAKCQKLFLFFFKILLAAHITVCRVCFSKNSLQSTSGSLYENVVAF